MFIWSCAIYRFYKTHTRTYTYTHCPYVLYTRPAETCIKRVPEDSAYTLKNNSYNYLCSRTGSFFPVITVKLKV